jgi:hypothetical protein
MQVHTDISMHNAHMKGPNSSEAHINSNGLKSLLDVLIEEFEYIVLPSRDRKIKEVVSIL